MARIFVFDDEPSILLMMKKMLEKEGYEVDIALNGKAGMELFEKHTPDLLITDLIMPEMEGMETIITLRKKFPELKIIAISGGSRLGTDNYLSSAKIFGANLIFNKPLVQKEFIRAVSILLDQNPKSV